MRAPKTFEDGMARLDTILTQMQSEDTTLAESVKLYAEAASLMEYCRATLEKVSAMLHWKKHRCRSTRSTQNAARQSQLQPTIEGGSPYGLRKAVS